MVDEKAREGDGLYIRKLRQKAGEFERHVGSRGKRASQGVQAEGSIIEKSSHDVGVSFRL
jgi:hypothetical protein